MFLSPNRRRLGRVGGFCETWRWPPSERFFSNRSRALARGLLLTSLLVIARDFCGLGFSVSYAQGNGKIDLGHARRCAFC